MMNSKSVSLYKMLIAAFLCAALICLFCACSGNNIAPDDPVAIDVLAPTDAAVPAYTVKPNDPDVTETVPSGTGSVDYTPDASEVLETPEGSEGMPSETPASSEGSSTETAPTETHNTGTPTNTPAPTGGGSGNSTAQPTQVPASPDPNAAPIWFDDSAPVYYDMDFDGRNEKISIEMKQQSGYNYTCTVSVTLGSNGKVITDSFTTEYFTKALVYNFNSGDHRAELLVSCGTGNRGQVTKIYRLNSSLSSFQSIAANGWVETLADNNSSIELGRYIDVLGTWACSSRFGFSTTDFSLVQLDNAWRIHRDSDRWCTVSKTLLVEIIIPNSTENYAGFLYSGDRLFPIESDLRTYIKFKVDYGDTGNITITVSGSGQILINGTSADNWFSDLQYIH